MSAPMLEPGRWEMIQRGGMLVLLIIFLVTAVRGDWIPRVWHEAMVEECKSDVRALDGRVRELEGELAAWHDAARGRPLRPPEAPGGPPAAR